MVGFFSWEIWLGGYERYYWGTKREDGKLTVYFSDAVMKGVKCSDKVPAVKQVKRSAALQVQQNM